MSTDNASSHSFFPYDKFSNLIPVKCVSTANELSAPWKDEPCSLLKFQKCLEETRDTLDKPYNSNLYFRGYRGRMTYYTMIRNDGGIECGSCYDDGLAGRKEKITRYYFQR